MKKVRPRKFKEDDLILKKQNQEESTWADFTHRDEVQSPHSWVSWAALSLEHIDLEKI